MTRPFLTLVGAGLLLAGCASDPSLTASTPSISGEASTASLTGKELPADAGMSLTSQRAKPEATRAPVALRKREVIRTATLAIRVDDLEADEKRINAVVAELGGYVSSVSSTDLAGSGATISIALRIPVRSFEEAIARFEAMGTRLSKTIAAEDVTSQAVDLDARLKTMRAQEEAVRSMMQGVREMNQILELQNRLAGLRGEIESLQAQRSTLAEQAALSTITVELHQSAMKTVPGPSTDVNWFAQTQGQAAGAAMGAFKAVVAVFIWAAYFSPIWLSLGLLAWWLARSTRRGTENSATIS